ncbi:MAG: response regulator transcription factor [Clostridia bacterium]|nr:response regulator transcription factor [Clostridia bacterium]
MNIKEKILIIEDDDGICKFLKTTLCLNNYGVVIARNGKTALEMAASHCPDCILLDLGLPDMDGNRIIESIRGWTTTPIIVISARITQDDKATALDLGADDYLTKPFGTRELLARIRVALRHARSSSVNADVALNGCYRVGDLVIDYRKHRVFIGNNDAGLTPNEYKIVALLGRHAGQVLTYNHILLELWGPQASGDNKVLRVHMANIRRKIDPNPDEPTYIITEAGVGYRMLDDEK